MDEIGAFRQFFEAHQRGVFSLLVHFRLEEDQAAELTQQVFVRVWETRHQYHNDEEKTAACYRYALSWGRSAAGGRRAPSTAHGDGLVYQALQGLPEEERVAVVLSRIVGLQPEQIARVLHNPAGRVRSVLRRAWNHLAAVLARVAAGGSSGVE